MTDYQISGISPLSDFTYFWQLDPTMNQINDISALSNLTISGGIYLCSNQIEDISPLLRLVETVEKPPDIWHITVKYDIGKDIAH